MPAQNANPYDTAGLVSCAQLAQDPALGRCAPGANLALLTADFTDYVKGLPSQRHGSLARRRYLSRSPGGAPGTADRREN